jgi:hypothetical protein
MMIPTPTRATRNVLAASLLACLALVISAGPAAAFTPAVGAGTAHACALSDTGTLKCWGSNNVGQLGDGGTTTSHVPVSVKGLPTTVEGLTTTDDATCALLTGGTVWCWGSNNKAALGNGSSDGYGTPHATPAAVPGLTGVTQISGTLNTICALLTNGTVKCWGGNGNGEIGVPPAGLQTTPLLNPNLSSVKSISVGYAHVCAVITDGTARCWGYNSGGPLGNGTQDASTTPVVVSGLTGVASIYASGYTSCAILAGGAVKCWGGDSNDMVGDGDGSGSLLPVALVGLAGVTSLGGGNNNNCAGVPTALLKCWGGMPGIGITGTVKSPTDVPAVFGPLAISQDGWGGPNCVLQRGGAVRCWGVNNLGQLGNDTTSPTPVPSPVQVSGLDTITNVYPSPAVSIAVVGKAKLDKKKKTYTLIAALRAAIPALVSPLESCDGAVLAQVKYSYKKKKKVKGKLKKVAVKKLAKATAALTGAGENCVSNLTLKLPVKYLNHKKVTVTATWPGNSSIAPLVAVAPKFTLPKVKVKVKRAKK